MSEGGIDVKQRNPEKNLIISWLVIGIGTMFALIGAMTMREYKVNLCLVIGFLVIVAGIVYHLLTVRCPYCGHSLAGYRPLPNECPECHKIFED